MKKLQNNEKKFFFFQKFPACKKSLNKQKNAAKKNTQKADAVSANRDNALIYRKKRHLATFAT
jgi:hypothetical protein